MGDLILGEVIVYVEDMSRAVSFYRDSLGLKVHYPIVTDYSKEFWVELESGGCTLALHAGANRQVGVDAPRFVFYVNDLESTRSVLLGKGVELGEIRSPHPGVLVTDGCDPEGNHFSIELKNPKSVASHTTPESGV